MRRRSSCSARARSVEPSAAIDELCRRLDDMPLAIELAAARTGVLTADQILDRLSQRLDLLKGGRDADPRQQTLRATIEWCHDLLSAEEQQLFARLAVFAGGCTLEAAEEVAGADLDTAPVAGRQEPRPAHRRALLDAGDDPRVRTRTPGGTREKLPRRGRRTRSTTSTSWKISNRDFSVAMARKQHSDGWRQSSTICVLRSRSGSTPTPIYWCGWSPAPATTWSSAATTKKPVAGRRWRARPGQARPLHAGAFYGLQVALLSTCATSRRRAGSTAKRSRPLAREPTAGRSARPCAAWGTLPPQKATAKALVPSTSRPFARARQPVTAGALRRSSRALRTSP